MFDLGEKGGRTQFLANLESQRLAKLDLCQKNDAAIKIQKHVRGFVVRRRKICEMRTQFDSVIPATIDAEHLPHSVKAFDTVRLFLHYQDVHDTERFRTLCRYVVLSCESADPKSSYIGAGISGKNRLPPWIACTTKLLLRCCRALTSLKMLVPADGKWATLYVHTLFTLTATNSWALLKTTQG